MAPEKDNITPRQAISIAIKYYSSTLRLGTSGSVEEVENKNGFWYITLGFSRSNILGLPIEQKDYRVFKIDEKTGKVIYMKIRE